MTTMTIQRRALNVKNQTTLLLRLSTLKKSIHINSVFSTKSLPVSAISS